MMIVVVVQLYYQKMMDIDEKVRKCVHDSVGAQNTRREAKNICANDRSATGRNGIEDQH